MTLGHDLTSSALLLGNEGRSCVGKASEGRVPGFLNCPPPASPSVALTPEAQSDR